MQSLRLRNLLSIFLTIILVVSFGFLGCKGSIWFVSSVSNGFLAKWTSLGTPPGKAVSIQAVASISPIEKTIVKTADGKFYIYQPGKFTNWVETTLPYPEKTDLSPECPGFDKPRPGLPAAIVDCEGFFSWEWQNTEDFYAVLEDGSVWRWRYGISFLKALSLYAVTLIFGALCGFLLSKPIRKLILLKLK